MQKLPVGNISVFLVLHLPGAWKSAGINLLLAISWSIQVKLIGDVSTH